MGMNQASMTSVQLHNTYAAPYEQRIAELEDILRNTQDIVVQGAIVGFNPNDGDLENFDKIKPIPERPISYEASYTRAIHMLELSVEASINLEAHEFEQLVLDEWHWKKSFSMINSSYKSLI